MDTIQYPNLWPEDLNEIRDLVIGEERYVSVITHLLGHAYEYIDVFQNELLETSVVIRLKIQKAGGECYEEFWVKPCFEPMPRRRR